MARKPKDEDDRKTVVDMKRGKAADDFKVPVDGTEDDRGANWKPSGETMDEFLALMDQMDGEVRELEVKKKAAAAPFNAKIAERRNKVADAKGKLVEDGYPAKALNTLMRQHRLRKEADRAPEELDEEQKRDHAKMAKVWKDFRSLPLGAAAESRETEAVH